MRDAVAQHKGMAKGGTDMAQEQQCEQRNAALVHCFQHIGQFWLLRDQIRHLEQTKPILYGSWAVTPSQSRGALLNAFSPNAGQWVGQSRKLPSTLG